MDMKGRVVTAVARSRGIMAASLVSPRSLLSTRLISMLSGAHAA